MARLVKVTAAPETTRPCGSVMVPRTVEVPVWLHNGAANRRTTSIKATSLTERMEAPFKGWLDGLRPDFPFARALLNDIETHRSLGGYFAIAEPINATEFTRLSVLDST